MHTAQQSVALVGMDIHLPGCIGLDAFDRHIYEGLRETAQQKTIGQSSLEDLLNDVCRKALDDAALRAPESVAILLQVQMGGERVASLFAPLTVVVSEDWIGKPASTASALVEQVRRVTDRFTSDCPGTLRILETQKCSTFALLELAQILLSKVSLTAVLIGIAQEQQAAAVVLVRPEKARAAKQRIYAVVESISLLRPSPGSSKNAWPPEAIANTCAEALAVAQCSAAAVGYLELLHAHSLEHDGFQIYHQPEREVPECALGSIEADLGNVPGSTTMASLIKTALCLYHRYIPGWSGPTLSKTSPFYMTTEAIPWFQGTTDRRVAAIDGIDDEEMYGHLLLAEEPRIVTIGTNPYLQQMPHLLVSLAADDKSSLIDLLHKLKETLNNAMTPLSQVAECHAHPEATYALGLVGSNREELLGEVNYALEGVTAAFETGKDWQTPAGSYFTAHPLGAKGKVAFVYPGSFSAYLGLGRNLFRLFPQLHDDSLIRGLYSRVSHIQKALYPRSRAKFTLRQLEAMEHRLTEDLAIMCETGIGFARIMARVMQGYFCIEPQVHLGYSLGEVSMICAQEVWEDIGALSADMNASPLFSHKLSGPKETIRTYWSVPEDAPLEDFWSVHVLIAPLEAVVERLKQERQVFLTHINTEKELVIAGVPEACRQVIADLQCEAFRAPFNHVVHCPPVYSEYDALINLLTTPVSNAPRATFYSAAEYEPLALDSTSISHGLTEALCQKLDFPRLVERAYADGARLFIELGPGSNCTRWIGEILKTQEHATVFLNRRNVGDHLSILKALAKLLSHRVPLDLSPLYKNESNVQNSNLLAEQVMVTNGLRFQSPFSTPGVAIPVESFGIPSHPAKPTVAIAPPQPVPSQMVQYPALYRNLAGANRATMAFLKMRQEALRTVAAAIRLQMAATSRSPEA
jgi:PfaB family protein